MRVGCFKAMSEIQGLHILNSADFTHRSISATSTFMVDPGVTWSGSQHLPLKGYFSSSINESLDDVLLLSRTTAR